jgi:hypothetical protein
MSAGAFLEKDRPPDRTQLEIALGERLPLWDRVAGWVEATYVIGPEPLYSSKTSGWITRYRRSGRSLVLLAPHVGGFDAVVVIGPSVAAAVDAMPLRPSTRDAFERAHPYPDGRWLKFELETAADAEEVCRLIAVKSPPPRRRGTSTRPASAAAI